jgi:glucokinase
VIVLAGDIGGTHARLALFRVEADGEFSILHERTVDSADYAGPAPVVREFLDGMNPGDAEMPSGACVAIAGPIKNGICEVPNLGWTLEVDGFAAEAGVEGATLINDFEAIGHGVPFLRSTDYAELQSGAGRTRAPIAILGPGTGLGHAFLIWEGGGYRVLPSEGGHADFAPRNDVEWALAEHLRSRFGHASWERVVSGPGLVETYSFLAARESDAESASVREELVSSSDPAGVISRLAMSGSDRLCIRALDTFVSALGAQAGNMALTLEAYGGVYLAGGIAPKILTRLEEPSFLEALRGKGRVSSLLERVPVRVILDDEIGLKGAARVAARDTSARRSGATGA